jgi:hypothetical protein
VHPGRPAVDFCPVCERPRCAADARAGAAGCLACAAEAARAARLTWRQPASRLEAWVRASLAGLAVCLIGAAICLEYVNAHIFSWVLPGLIGTTCAAATVVAAAPYGRRSMRILGAAFGVASALEAFRFATTSFGPPGRWWPPVVAAAAGALFLPGLISVKASRPSRRTARPGPKRSSSA